MIDAGLLIIVGGAIVSGFIQGLSGFAFSLTALSIWAWAVEPQLAAPMAVFGSLVGQLTTLPMLWRGFDYRGMVPFILGGLVGVPLGVFVLHQLDPALFKFALGLFLVVYCPVLLILPPTTRVAFGGVWANAVAGWIGGVLGGIGGAAGAVPTLWTTLRGWSKEEQRGVLQGFNIAMHVTTLCTYAATGTLDGEVWRMFAIIAPVIVLPALLGAMIFARIGNVAFRRIVLGLLAASGVVLVWGSVLAWVGK